jgi:hypothetical protein
LAFNLEVVALQSFLGRPDTRAGRLAGNVGGDFQMYQLDGSWFAVVGLFLALLLLSKPRVWRVVVRLAGVVAEWATTHWKRADEADREEEELWQMERRRRLYDDLRRVEHLVATDSYMSATRQRANRIAYNRLVYDLRHTPDVFPTAQPQTFGTWYESDIDPRSTTLINKGYSKQQPTVEVLEIGWRRRGH